jgi:hypothetical protein
MSDTSAIDGKKTDSSSTGDFEPKKMGNFILSLVVVIIMILTYFGFGGCILFMCKVAQSNILPTQKKCMPYESNDPVITPIKTNIFVTFTDPPLSEKISFSYLQNKENTILDMLREYKEDPDSYFLINYFISIMESITRFNYASLNSFFNLLNQAPELLVVFFGPMIALFFITMISVFDNLYLVFLWFYNMGWFFKKNVNTSGSGKPKWENSFNLFSLIIGWWLIVFFSIVFFFGMITCVFPLSISLLMAVCLFTIVSCQGEMNGAYASVLVVMKDLYKNYKVTIASTITFFIILLAFINLGSLPGLFSIITVILIYFGVISIEIFQPIKQNIRLSGLVSYKQAKKICKVEVIKPAGLGVRILNRIFQKGGKNLAHEIKSLSKTLNN